ncbi:adenylyl-sulfate kinase [Alphaproteobacteria bacterium]|nr:adenylyl-sulfate kinase [Alphaproteobacteria bacterium]
MNNILKKNPKHNIIKKLLSQDTLKFITCGSVDDGKSTLIGRILYDSKSILIDQIEELEKDTKKYSPNQNKLDFSLLLDGLSSEREQKITIDVAYRFFRTAERNFIVADTPGHVEFTKNMVSGASNADLAILLVDARSGINEQTKRHTFICHLMGINHIVLAVNKMDLIRFDQQQYLKIVKNFLEFTKIYNFKNIHPIPISALTGDNIVKSKTNINYKWYAGPSMIEHLESVQINKSNDINDFTMPIQWINRSGQDFRGYAGLITSGTVSVGDDIQIHPKGTVNTVKKIILYNQDLPTAVKGQSVTIVLENQTSISRGDVISNLETNISSSNQFDTTIVWFSDNPGISGRFYLMKLASKTLKVEITKIKSKLDINTGMSLNAEQINLNDICTVNIRLGETISYQSYKENKDMGSFILIDLINKKTLAGGMINFALNRADNIFVTNFEIQRQNREKLLGQNSKVFWLTGLSGSGKSTIANHVANFLHNKGYLCYVLDGDNVRSGLNKDLGFKNSDRVENIRRIGEVSKLMVDAGIIVITAAISPFKSDRQAVKNLFKEGDFFEIFVDTPIEVCITRDPKGLYKKAKNNKITNFTGIDSEYEIPDNPDLILKHNLFELDDLGDIFYNLIQ